MTSNKDELILLVIVAIMISVGLSAIMIVVSSHSWFESASPCELGLMEWEEERVGYDFFRVYMNAKCPEGNICSFECFGGQYGCDECCFEPVCSDDCGTQVIIKSCPYSGPGIMVVKE